MCDPIIDPEFASLMPRLSAEEKSILAEKINDEGMREPIITWRNIIIDGHNRYEICMAESLPFECKEMKFAGRSEVLRWMYRNQKGRRNMSESQTAMIAAKIETADKGSNQHVPRGAPSTQASVAKEFNISKNTLIRAKKVVALGSDELKEAVTDGHVTVNSAAMVAKLPKPEQIKLVRKGSSAVAAAAKFVSEKKPIPSFELPDATPFDEAQNCLKRVMGAIHHLCGDGNEKKPSESGKFIASHRQELESHVDALRKAMRSGKPYSQCPYCLGKDKRCEACLGGGWVPEIKYKSATAEEKARVKVEA